MSPGLPECRSVQKGQRVRVFLGAATSFGAAALRLEESSSQWPLVPGPRAAPPSLPLVAQSFPSVARLAGPSYLHSHSNSQLPDSWLPSPSPPLGAGFPPAQAWCHPVWGRRLAPGRNRHSPALTRLPVWQEDPHLLFDPAEETIVLMWEACAPLLPCGCPALRSGTVRYSAAFEPQLPAP